MHWDERDASSIQQDLRQLLDVGNSVTDTGAICSLNAGIRGQKSSCGVPSVNPCQV
jgi:hypothetical protein